ncbi:MAG: HEAT repeat domain-containing protein [Planctomycetales bacterium]|nr:HEAT repeat domain-containing protein [Planctomycetales bacterium]
MTRIVSGGLMIVLCVFASGCHDGPLYGLKQVNPYYVMREWKRDKTLGVTDHERRIELQSLANQIGDMNAKDQAFWATHLGKIMNNDPSPEMRRLSVLAASELKTPNAIALIERGLDDENLKVQMEACRSLGKRPEPEAAQMLASVLGTTPEPDVKNSAIAALGKHKGNISVDSLRLILEDQNPATTYLAMNSLRGVMGKDYGNDPKQWIAAIDQQRIPAGGAVPGSPAGPTGSDDQLRYAERNERQIR